MGKAYRSRWRMGLVALVALVGLLAGAIGRADDTPACGGRAMLESHLPPECGSDKTPIGLYVWEDVNSNGFRDDNEPGVPGVTVMLYGMVDGAGEFIAETVTDSLGRYGFYLSLPKGPNYYLKVDLDELRERGYVLTKTDHDNPAPNDSRDSDFNSITGETASFSAGYQPESLTRDAGLVRLPSCDAALDLMLVLDGSRSIQDDEFELMKQFAANLVGSFEVNQHKAHVGVIQFNATGHSRAEINLYQDEDAVISAINRMNRITTANATDIREGLRLAQKQFDTAGRPRIPRAILLLTDGNQTSTGDPIREARAVKAAGTVIYGLVVPQADGGDPAEEVVREIASRPDLPYFYERISFGDMPLWLDDVVQAVCHTPIKPELAPVPVSPSNEALTNGLPTFEWLPVAGVGAMSYQIQIGSRSSFSQLEWDFMTDELRYIPPELKESAYYWRVRAVNVIGSGKWSETRHVLVSLMQSPANGTFDPNTTPAFRWLKVAGAMGYRLEIAKDKQFADRVRQIDFNERTVRYTPSKTEALLPDTVYYWRVSPKLNGAWVTSTLSWKLAITANNLRAPTLVSPANRKTEISYPTFEWMVVPDAADYRLQVDDSSQFDSPLVDVTTGGANQFTVDESYKLPDGRLYWRVQTLNTLGAPGRWSAVWSLTLDALPPEAPTIIYPKNTYTLHDLTPTFNWQAVPGGVSYNFEIARSDQKKTDEATGRYLSPVISTNTATLSYTPSGEEYLPQGLYIWHVQAVDAYGRAGAWTANYGLEISVLRSPALDAVTTDTTPTFEWHEVKEAASGYQIQVATDPEFKIGTISREFTGKERRTTRYTPETGLEIIGGEPTNYFWRVNLKMDENAKWEDSPITRKITIQSPSLDTPTIVAPANGVTIGDVTPRLVWQSVRGASSYIIRLDGQDVGSSSRTDYTVPNGSALAQGVHNWQVKAQTRDGGESDWSRPVYFTVALQRSPANEAIITDTTPTFVWYTRPDATAYTLRIAGDTECADNAIPDYVIEKRLCSSQTCSLTLEASKALDYGAYFWCVIPEGETDPPPVSWRLTIEPNTLPAPAPMQPANRSIISMLPVVFKWSAVDGAARYQLQLDDTSDISSPVREIVIETLEATLDGLLDDHYYWRVRALDVSNRPGRWSQVWSFILESGRLPAGESRLIAPPDGMIFSDSWWPTLTWAGGGVVYDIQIAADAGFARIVQAATVVNEPSYTAFALDDGTYYWRVRVEGGAWSAARRFVIRIP